MSVNAFFRGLSVGDRADQEWGFVKRDVLGGARAKSDNLKETIAGPVHYYLDSSISLTFLGERLLPYLLENRYRALDEQSSILEKESPAT